MITIIKNRLRPLTLLSLSALFTACGGGSDATDTFNFTPSPQATVSVSPPPIPTTPTPVPAPTLEPLATPSTTVAPTNSATPTPSSIPNAASPTPTTSPLIPATPQVTAVPAITPTPAINPTPIATETPTPTSSPLASPTATLAPTPTPNLTPLPQIIRIEAEDYTDYADVNEENTGGNYREDGVDLFSAIPIERGFYVGHIEDGEWLEFEVELDSVTYAINSRVASKRSNGDGAFSLSINGTPITQDLISSTGGWQAWESHYLGTYTATRGLARIRIDVIHGEFNLNWLEFIDMAIYQPLPVNEAALFSFASLPTTTRSVNTIEHGVRTANVYQSIHVTDARSSFGGSLAQRVEATGFFRTEKIDGVWYMVDPEGYLFLSVGLNTVNTGGAVELPGDLKNLGFNTLGSWSEWSQVNTPNNRIPYTRRWNFMDSYSEYGYSSLFRTRRIYPVFNSDFESHVENRAKTHTQFNGKTMLDTVYDPYLIGHFSDNELHFYTFDGSPTIDRYLSIDNKSDPNYLAAHNWMTSRKGEGYSISIDDRQAFEGYVVETYYRKVSRAMKRVDPNHLFLGSRFHGATKNNPYIFAAIKNYVDIISVNYYDQWTPSVSAMNMWVAQADKPFIITEYYTKGRDSGLLNKDGAGWELSTQQERAWFYDHWAISLLKHPGCVGWHWFKYRDDKDSNKGIISQGYQWWTPLTDAMTNTNKSIYSLKAYYTDN